MQPGMPLGIIGRDEEGVGEIRSRRDRGGIGHKPVTRSCHADIARRKTLNDPEDLQPRVRRVEHKGAATNVTADTTHEKVSGRHRSCGSRDATKNRPAHTSAAQAALVQLR